MSCDVKKCHAEWDVSVILEDGRQIYLCEEHWEAYCEKRQLIVKRLRPARKEEPDE